VLRFPKRREIEQQLFAERRIVAVIANGSPLPVPEFSIDGKPSELFPMEFAGYRKLAGVPGIEIPTERLDFNGLAKTFAEFLSFLHSIPTERATQLGAVERQYDFMLDDLRSDALDNLSNAISIEPSLPYDSLQAFLAKGIVPADQIAVSRKLVHGDLAAEHVLVDPHSRRVTGIIDWTEAGIGDPAIDFAGMYHWGGSTFLNELLMNYRGEIDRGVTARARYFAACKAVDDIIFGDRMQRPEYIRAGMRAMKLVLNP
jgi:aminoglycoside phosphotransferase (APT) family kinase protein